MAPQTATAFFDDDSGAETCGSFSLTTFSPSGKLVQIEHALAAVAGGTTSLGIKGEPLARFSRKVL